MSTRKKTGRSDDDFDCEVRAHIELETDRLIEEGMAPAEARLAARRRFGNVTTVKERFHEAGRRLWLDDLRQDVRCALRSLRRYPVPTLVAVLSLAAGIGASTVTLTVRNAVFHKPPPTYRNPEQLSRVHVSRAEGPVQRIGSRVPAGLYAIWRETLGSSIAAAATRRGERDVRTGDRTESTPIRAGSPELFSVLGVEPVVGTISTGWTVGAAAPAPVALSHGTWHRLFDGRPDVVGQILWIDDQPHSVVAVMPQRFWFGEMNSPIWTVLDPRTVPPDELLDVVVRREPGVTRAMLEARLQVGLSDFTERLPADQRRWLLRTSGVEGTPLGQQVSIVLPYLLGTCVLLTLLIACANVAILMIAQWTAREHEIAIRASIGASRARIVRSLLTESVLVAALGGMLGVCATIALRSWIVLRAGGESGFFDLTIDTVVLVQTAVIALVTGIVAGITPALYETRRLHTNPLRIMAGSDRVRQRVRHALVVFEVAVTIALLVVTTAMIDGYRRTTRAQLGYATRPLMVARVENPKGVPAARVLDVLNNLPGVAVAAASSSVLPFASRGTQHAVAVDATGVDAIVAGQTGITGRFFDVLGVPMHAGRTFSDRDSASRAVIVNESLAKRLFPNRSPVGSQIWIEQSPFDVVGVVADYASNPMRQGTTDAAVFLPLPVESGEATRVSFVIRAQGDPAPLVQAVRREVREALVGTAVTTAYTIDQILDVAGQEILMGTAPLFPLIAIGMLLTTAGIYGVLAFAITRRSRELALRVAVGAGARDLIRLVVAHTARLLVTGSLVGIAITFGLSRLVRAGGGAGSIYDPPVHAFIVPVLIVMVIGALATWIPSRRVLEIDPVVLLRTT